MSNPHGLNARQLKFAQGIVAGKTQKQAAIDAGYSVSRAEATGSRMVTYGKVQAYIAEMRAKVEETVLMSREQAVGCMLEIVEGKHKEDGKADATGRTAAYDKAARTLGWYEPEKLEVTGSWADRIRKRSQGGG